MHKIVREKFRVTFFMSLNFLAAEEQFLTGDTRSLTLYPTSEPHVENNPPENTEHQNYNSSTFGFQL